MKYMECQRCGKVQTKSNKCHYCPSTKTGQLIPYYLPPQPKRGTKEWRAWTLFGGIPMTKLIGKGLPS